MDSRATLGTWSKKQLETFCTFISYLIDVHFIVSCSDFQLFSFLLFFPPSSRTLSLKDHHHKTQLQKADESTPAVVEHGSPPLPSVQLSRSACPTLCDPMDYSTTGFPVHHQLPEPTQTYVHHFGDAIQPSHSLVSPSPPAFNLSQHLFQWVSSSHQVAKVLEFQLQHQSFQWIFRTDFL